MTRKEADALEDELLGLGLADVQREQHGGNVVTLVLTHPGHPRPIVLERPSDWPTWKIVLRHADGLALSDRLADVRGRDAQRQADLERAEGMAGR